MSHNTPSKSTGIGHAVKRLIDIVITCTALVILAPVNAIIAIVVLIDMGSPIFFRQTRPGYKGKPFDVIKFRTMRNTVGGNGQPLSDGERLTRLGTFLRRTSLDELPQLWNVLRGDMSLVGPRPLLMEYLDRYTPEQMRRHDMKPGITGISQINGRQQIPFSKRLELDVYYIDHWSLWLDGKILILTIRQVVSRAGVLPGQEVTDVDDLGLSRAAKSKGCDRDASA